VRLDDVEESSNVEDRRGAPTGKLVAGGGIGTIVIAIIVMLLGGNPQQVLDAAGQGMATAPTPGQSRALSPEDERAATLVKKVLKETEDVWTDIFRAEGQTYQVPKLVLFSDLVDTECGKADSGVGPFYCPADSKVYIDLSFYKLMEQKLGGGGDFAEAYVIAHEVGHHIQNIVGTSSKVEQARRRLSESQSNALSVRMELQADFYAGVWAHHAKRLKIDKQDIEEAINTAAAIGDDRLQKQSQGYVKPESFTHGTSDQRVRWFMKGYQSGDMNQGDTFKTRNL
jgi:uncharacterized protein